LYDFFFIRGYCSDLKPRLYLRKIKNYEKIYTGYEFNTYTFLSFNWIYDLFYKNGKKIINSEIENYITPLSLAIWIMDDGGWVQHGIRISSNAFTYNEVLLLTQILHRKFKIETTIQKLSKPTNLHQNSIYNNKYSIYITSSSVSLVRSLVLPYTHSSMVYKLGIKD